MEDRVRVSAVHEGVTLYSLEGVALELGYGNATTLQSRVRDWLGDGYLERGVDCVFLESGEMLQALKAIGLIRSKAPNGTVISERGRRLIAYRSNTPASLVEKKRMVIDEMERERREAELLRGQRLLMDKVKEAADEIERAQKRADYAKAEAQADLNWQIEDVPELRRYRRKVEWPE